MNLYVLGDDIHLLESTSYKQYRQKILNDNNHSIFFMMIRTGRF